MNKQPLNDGEGNETAGQTANQKNTHRQKIAQQEHKIDEILQGLFYFLIFFVILVLVAILFSYSTWARALTVAASFLTISGAYLVSGAIVGFLFAIPRSGTYRYKAGSENARSWYDDNTNLEEISDWLTKIIVGLSLVQFPKILALTERSAQTMAEAFADVNVPGNQLYPFAFAIIVFFIAFGFAISYMWTRINFALILTVSRKRLNEISKIEEQKAQAEKDLKQTKAELEKVTDDAIAIKAHSSVMTAETTSFVNDVQDPMDTQKSRLRQLIEASRSIPVLDPTDMQKGRWGGKDEVNGKRLSAEIPDQKGEEFGDKVVYDLLIKVSKTDPGAQLESPVAIFVHDTFRLPDNVVIADVDANGEARVVLPTYEAFTVGALCLDGTKLELDLNEVKGFPSGFYW